MAEAKVQPVPWVCFVSIRFDVSVVECLAVEKQIHGIALQMPALDDHVPGPEFVDA